MLGLGRPKLLRTRPSLLQLISKRNIDELSQPRTLSHLPKLEDDVDDLPPLPASRPSSPTKTEPPFPFPTSIAERIHTKTMAPARTDEEEQGGKIFSISGPVIVAENMIGCAMYELVGLDLVTAPAT